MEENQFAKLAAINVGQHIEKKNNLSYLSWAWAVDQLLRHDPAANWSFGEPQLFGETMMVSCTVTAFGKPVTMHLPVMDHRNQAIKNPDAFAVNKNMMRCLVKAIACHGLGLYIYAGEDLPADDNQDKPEQPKGLKHKPTDGAIVAESRRHVIADVALAIHDRMRADDTAGAFGEYQEITDPEEKTLLWSQLSSTIRTALKKYGESIKETA